MSVTAGFLNTRLIENLANGQKHKAKNVMIKILPILTLAILAIAGCTPLPTTQQNISAASQINNKQAVSAQQAHEVCEQFGAAPGTRMFYNCMKEQTEASEYNVALANCKSDGYSRQAKLECLRGGSGIFGMHSCLQYKVRECERAARLSYLPDSNAIRIEGSDHQYIHSYSHTHNGSSAN